MRQRTSQKAQGDTKHARRPTFYQGSRAFQDLPVYLLSTLPPRPRTLTILLNHPSKTPTITFPLSSFYFLEKHDDLKASSCCLERYCSFERPLALKRTTAEFFLEITCRGDELKKRKKVCVCVCACICKRKEREGGREENRL